MDDPEDLPPPATAKPSTTPSWVMLGFVLGVLTMLVLPRSEKKSAAPVTVTLVAPPKPALPAPEKPTVERAEFFEAVFTELNRTAVWQDDLTEVAFWNASRRAFSDCYEVLKVGDKFYFRSIPHLTRPVLTEGVSPDSPLQFTVPGDAKRQESKAFRAMWNLELGPLNSAPVPSTVVPVAVPPVDKPLVEPPPEIKP